MDTKDELNFRVPATWYSMIKSASYTVGISISDIVKMGLIKGLIRIYSEGYAVVDVVREMGRSEGLVPIKASVPRWLKNALRSFAQDLDMDVSSLARACLFVGLELYKGSVTLNIGLDDREKRFVETMKSVFEGAESNG